MKLERKAEMVWRCVGDKTLKLPPKTAAKQSASLKSSLQKIYNKKLSKIDSSSSSDWCLSCEMTRDIHSYSGTHSKNQSTIRQTHAFVNVFTHCTAVLYSTVCNELFTEEIEQSIFNVLIFHMKNIGFLEKEKVQDIQTVVEVCLGLLWTNIKKSDFKYLTQKQQSLVIKRVWFCWCCCRRSSVSPWSVCLWLWRRWCTSDRCWSRPSWRSSSSTRKSTTPWRKERYGTHTRQCMVLRSRGFLCSL